MLSGVSLAALREGLSLSQCPVGGSGTTFPPSPPLHESQRAVRETSHPPHARGGNMAQKQEMITCSTHARRATDGLKSSGLYYIYKCWCQSRGRGLETLRLRGNFINRLLNRRRPIASHIQQRLGDTGRIFGPLLIEKSYPYFSNPCHRLFASFTPSLPSNLGTEKLKRVNNL